MKKTLVLCLGILILAPLAHPQDKHMRVTSVRVEVSEREFSGRCPHTFQFTGTIQVNRAGTVRYRWLRSDNALSPEKTLTFRVPGTRTVTSSWTLGSTGSLSQFVDRWKAIQVIAPNEMRSNDAVFTLKCLAIIVFPTYEISGNLAAQQPSGSSLNGMNVKVILSRDGARVREQTVTLSGAGGGSYVFGRWLSAGTYQIRVEAAPGTHPYGLNVDFDGTTPAARTVTLGPGSTQAAGQDFVINWSICWNVPTPCWHDGP